ncbi:HEAT repeat domain-containing protein [Tenacibaculum agarivorans]|uniref:HEAT repeat domain-containing protein n=1 Tax=Tenacibaculum agarivorans TaxID=1908389 RepID=UPI00094BAAFD|nr:HEAT repeat domain-containing protein [Tenacibaculum agarivorans]
MMECREIKDRLMAYAMDEISEEEKQQIDHHIESCKGCVQELEETIAFLNVLNTVKEEQPSTQLKENFEALLEDEINKEERPVLRLSFTREWTTFVKVAASILVVLGSFFLGKVSNTNASNQQQQQKILLALLENQSASKRILAISKTNSYSIKDTRIIDALINKMFVDKNVNVRLAAAEALAKFSSLEKVRDALLKALEIENEPSIQIELIQILAEIQEKRALTPMQKLLDNEETPNYVKQELAYSMPNLI